MHDQHGQSGAAVLLPMTVTTHLHSVFDLDEAALGIGQQVAGVQEMRCQRLQMTATQATPGDKLTVGGRRRGMPDVAGAWR